MNIYSSITPELKRMIIVRGTFFAFIGAITILMVGAFCSVEFIKTWGLCIWLAGVGLIAYGLIPYRMISLLSVKPNKIYIDEREVLHYHAKGKHYLSVPLSQIDSIHYISSKRKYGILLKIGKKTYFLPYFTEKACSKITHDCQNYQSFP